MTKGILRPCGATEYQGGLIMGLWSRLWGTDKEHNAKVERKAEMQTVIDTFSKIGDDVQKSTESIAGTLLGKIRELELRMKELDNRLKTEKIYKLTGQFYLNVAKKRGKIIVHCNSEQFLEKLKEIIKGETTNKH